MTEKPEAATRKDFLEALQALRLIDAAFFNACFDGQPGCMQLLLRIILGKPALVVTKMHTQSEVPKCKPA